MPNFLPIRYYIEDVRRIVPGVRYHHVVGKSANSYGVVSHDAEVTTFLRYLNLSLLLLTVQIHFLFEESREYYTFEIIAVFVILATTFEIYSNFHYYQDVFRDERRSTTSDVVASFVRQMA